MLSVILDVKNLLKICKFPEKLEAATGSVLWKIGVLKSFKNFTGKRLCWRLALIKLQSKACNFIKKRLQQWRCPVKFAKYRRLFWRTSANDFSSRNFFVGGDSNLKMVYCQKQPLKQLFENKVNWKIYAKFQVIYLKVALSQTFAEGGIFRSQSDT